jgi:hypothetical protein
MSWTIGRCLREHGKELLLLLPLNEISEALVGMWKLRGLP